MLYNLYCNSQKINIFDNNNIIFSLNKNLTNGILLIHPIILYLSYGLILFIIFKKFFKKNIFFFFNKYFFFSKYNYYICVYILLISVFLGSWWAEQELGWGGWWSWDFIEIISINFIFILLFLIHNIRYKNFIFYYELNLFIKIFIFMLIVRFNFLDSVHNFISNNFFFQFFYEFIFVFFSIYLIFFFNKLFFIQSIKFNKNTNYLSSLFMLITINLLFYLASEFLFLVQPNLNLINFFLKNKLLYYTIIFIYIYMYTEQNIIKFFNIFFFNYFEYFYLNIFFFKSHKNYNIYLIHLVLFILIYIHLFYNYIFDFSDYIFYKNIFNFNLNLHFLNYFNFFLNFDFFLEFYNDFLSNKIIYSYNNQLSEFFSFNYFLLFFLNINIVFINYILFIMLYIFKLKKKIYF